ncbi:MAG TPA: DUF1385 domain-containing protein [Candidatus Krumholzibacteria bacterium]|nr:DUF1385 domain-containing protein [Candidatus Krumholzibacteria bacterium]
MTDRQDQFRTIPSARACPDQVGVDDARSMDLAVGGQALIEGVMMRSPRYLAMAVRTPDKRIVIRKKTFKSVVRSLPFLNIPVLRGGVHLIETMGLGIDALMFSADQAVSEDRVEGKKSSKRDTALMWLTVGFSFVLSLGLFFYLPIILTDLVVPKEHGSLAWNAVDGLIRVVLFVAYLWGVSKLPDMGRVFQYHGAEHKSIHAFENGSSLDAAGGRPWTTLHPRCGTSFLFFVMLISIIVFSFLGRPETIGDRLQRLAFVPVIGGLAYEAIKLSGKFGRAWFVKPAIWPGLMLQKITTSEPDDDQLSVAMAALRAVLTPEADDFRERVYYDLPDVAASGGTPAAEGGVS